MWFGPTDENISRTLRSSDAACAGGHQRLALFLLNPSLKRVCADAAYGPDHMGAILLRAARAGVLEELRRHEEALAEYDTVVRWYLRSPQFGPRHLSTARVRNNRAMVLNHLRRHREALRELAWVVALRTKLLDTGDPLIFRARGNYAETLMLLGRFGGALAEMEAVVRGYSAACGPSHHDTLHARECVASLELLMGDVEQAATHFGELVGPFSELLGDSNDLTVNVRISKAMARAFLGFSREARVELTTISADLARSDNSSKRRLASVVDDCCRLVDRLIQQMEDPLEEGALSRIKGGLGGSSFVERQWLSWLPRRAARIAVRLEAARAAMLWKTGDPEAALPALTTAVEHLTQSRRYGPAHPHTLQASISRATLLIDLNRADEAVAELSRLMAVLIASLGPDDKMTLVARDRRARALAATGQFGQSRREYVQLAEAYARRLGPKSDEALRARAFGDQQLHRMGRDREAANDLEEVIREYTRKHGHTDDRTIEARGLYATVLTRCGQSAKALLEIEDVIAIRTQRLGAQHPDTLRPRATRAEILVSKGQPNDACAELQAVVTLYPRSEGVIAQEFIVLRDNLAVALREAGRLQESLYESEAVVELAIQTLGPTHPDTILARLNKGLVYLDMGLFEDATSEVAWSANASAGSLGPTSALSVMARTIHAKALGASGHIDIALEEMLAVDETVRHHDHLDASSPAAIQAQLGLAEQLLVAGRITDAGHVLQACRRANDTGLDMPDPLALTLRQLEGLVLAESGNVPNAIEHLNALADECWERSDTNATSLIAAETYLALSRLLIESAGLDEALASALRALSLLEARHYALAQSTGRQAWSAAWEHALATVLELALSHGDDRLAVELIETARMHAIPARPVVWANPALLPLDRADPIVVADMLPNVLMPFRFNPGNDSRHVALNMPSDPGFSTVEAETAGTEGPSVLAAALGDDPIENPPCVMVGGASALARVTEKPDAEGSALPPRQTVSLEGVAADLCDDSAVVTWWGMHVVGGRLLQSLATRQDGVWAFEAQAQDWCGDGGGLSELAMTVKRWREVRDSLLNSHCESSAGEPSMSAPWIAPAALAEIARALVPPRLAALIAEMAEGGAPMWLIVAPARELADLPLAYLPVQDPIGEAPSPKLILDGATLIYSPSVGFSAAVRRRHGPPSVHATSVAVTIADPHDDCDYATPLASATTTLLGRFAAPDADAIATRGNTVAAMRGANGGIVHIAAHVEWDTDRPSDNAILLADDEKLTARELASDASHCPASAVIMACCASVGAPRTSAEWLGLGPAFLWAGAGAVLGTLWPIFDCPAATEVEHTLAEALAVGTHPAVALRDIQRRYLAMWRAGHGFSVSLVDLGGYITMSR